MPVESKKNIMEENFTYIKKSIPSEFVVFAEPLKSEEYDNLGETWQDYLDNKWVLLNEQQVAFHRSNPTASVKEVFDMQLAPAPLRTLEQAKREKLQQIEEYDQSEAVNSFTLGNQSMWLTVNERQQLATQISANEAIGRETMTRYFDGQEFTFPLAAWKQMLVALEVYAGDALNSTEAHKIAVNALKTVEEVDSYNHEANYPEKLNFTV